MRETIGRRLKAPAIPIPREAVAEFCRRNQIRKLALFGSVLRSDFGPESDVDVLVELEPEASLGFHFFVLGDELSEILGGRKVDLGTFASLHRLIRDEVLKDIHVVYAAGG